VSDAALRRAVRDGAGAGAAKPPPLAPRLPSLSLDGAAGACDDRGGSPAGAGSYAEDGTAPSSETSLDSEEGPSGGCSRAQRQHLGEDNFSELAVAFATLDVM